MFRLSVKTTVTLSIGILVILAQLVAAVLQYQAQAKARLDEIQSVAEASVLPLADLGARGVDGGNAMILSGSEANALFKSTKVLYLRMSGRSAGAEKTLFAEAIPPQDIAHRYVGDTAREAELQAIAEGAVSSGIHNKARVYVVKTPLANVKNGGELVAVFSADKLNGLEMAVARQVALSTVVIITIAVLLALVIGHDVSAPMLRIAAQIRRCAETLNLQERIVLTARDRALNREAGEAAEAFNHLIATLQKLLQQVSEQTSQVMQASTALTTSAKQVAASSDQQNSAVLSMSGAAEEMAASLEYVATSAQEAKQVSVGYGDQSAQGGAVIHHAAVEMTQISASVERAASIISTLGEQSQQITAIVKVIKDIAGQTNLLALNAAIEAARAGEQGRGFAVVADEVRKLAERTTQSTAEITAMVDTIQSSAQTAVDCISDSVHSVKNGGELAIQAEHAVQDIGRSAALAVQAITAISESLQEQNAASQNILHNISVIHHMSEDNNNAARLSASAADSLQVLANNMRLALARFVI